MKIFAAKIVLIKSYLFATDIMGLQRIWVTFIVATRADRLVRLEFAKNQYHRFSIALFIHLFLFKVRVTGIIRKGIN